LAALFQPVHAVVPPGSADRFIAPPNQNYMNALMALQASLEAVGGQPQATDAAASTALNSASAARVATRQVAQVFRIDPDAHIETVVQKLMEDPITYAEALLRNVGPAELNGKGKALSMREPDWPLDSVFTEEPRAFLKLVIARGRFDDGVMLYLGIFAEEPPQNCHSAVLLEAAPKEQEWLLQCTQAQEAYQRLCQVEIGRIERTVRAPVFVSREHTVLRIFYIPMKLEKNPRFTLKPADGHRYFAAPDAILERNTCQLERPFQYAIEIRGDHRTFGEQRDHSNWPLQRNLMAFIDSEIGLEAVLKGLRVPGVQASLRSFLVLSVGEEIFNGRCYSEHPRAVAQERGPARKAERHRESCADEWGRPGALQILSQPSDAIGIAA
jgi:hypothetical protein